jgi:hypothetical protein
VVMPAVNEDICLAQLNVGDLNKIMWFNFQRMQAQTMHTVMTNMRSMISDTVNSEIARVEKTFEERFAKLEIDCAKKTEVNERVGKVEIRQLEMDIDYQEVKKNISDIKSQLDQACTTQVEDACNIIMKNFEFTDEEALNEIALETNVREMFESTLGLPESDINIMAVKRLKSIPTRNGIKAGHVVITLKSKEDQSKIMKLKGSLKNSEKYKKVWIEAEKAREVRAMEKNCRMLLKEMGKEKEYTFRGSALVKRNATKAVDEPEQNTSHAEPSSDNALPQH